MRLDDISESENVEDVRGGRGRLVVGGGVGTLVLIILGLVFGIDPRALLDSSGARSGEDGRPAAYQDRGVQPDDGQKRFVAKVLKSTEDVWTDELARMGKRYEKPKLVLFRDQVQSACGLAGAAVGPFYCPGDDKVYLDLEFFDELARRFKAPGDFAQAYVIAHEVGHHVQNLMGISQRMDAQRARLSKAEQNALSVRLELQADFFAGLWANHANKQSHILEPGDMEEGLRAASAIGDDRLQMQARGRVVPDAFTHGSSAQRLKWFRKGMETGDFRQGDTFAVTSP
jgi:predicted metalloprotease